MRDLERDNRRLVAEKADLVRAADTRLEELSDLHKQGDEVIRNPTILFYIFSSLQIQVFDITRIEIRLDFMAIRI